MAAADPMERNGRVLEIRVDGMMCGHCEGTVRDALKAVDGVESVESVSHEKENAKVLLAHGVDRDDALKRIEAAIDGTGYSYEGVLGAKDDEKGVVLEFRVDGMMCDHCEGTIRDAVGGVDGVLSVDEVSADDGRLIVRAERFDTGLEKSIVSKVSEAGYEVVDRVLEFDIDGMMCEHCETTIREAVNGEMAGVEVKSISHEEEKLVARLGPNCRVEEVKEMVKKSVHDSGYEVVEKKSDKAAPPPKSVPKQENDTFVPVEGIKFRFLVEGMHCSNCSASVEGAMRTVQGVLRADVSVLTSEAVVTVRDEDVKPEMISQAVGNAGYSAEFEGMVRGGEEDEGDELSAEELERRAEKAQKEAFWEMASAAPFALALLLIHLVLGMAVEWKALETHISDDFPMTVSVVLQMILAWIVQLWHGQKFYKRAWRSVSAKGARLGMDALIVCGTTAAVVFSTVAAFVAAAKHEPHPALHFDAGASVIFFVLVGDYVKIKAKGRATSALHEILQLRPPSAILVTRASEAPTDAKRIEVELPEMVENLVGGDGDVIIECVVVDPATIEVDQIVRILPGDRVPADCIVVHGEGGADEALLTGESVPLAKKPGDPLLAGTTVTGSVLYAKAKRSGKHSAVSEMARLIRDAQNTKSPVEDLVDRVAAVFTPTVIVISVLTLITWLVVAATIHEPDKYFPPHIPGGYFAVTTAVTVLIIACPCALGLATPTAVVAGMSLGSRHGLVVKSAEALQNLAALGAVVLDKTGTITTGKFALRASDPISTDDAHRMLATVQRSLLPSDALLWIAGSVESASEHPIAAAISSAARARRKPAPGEKEDDDENEPVLRDHAHLNTLAPKTIVNRNLPELCAPQRSVTVPGQGILAEVNGHKVVVGTPELVHDPRPTTDADSTSPQGGKGAAGSSDSSSLNFKPAVIPQEIHDLLRQHRRSGATAVVVAIDGLAVGVLAVADSPRPESAAAIAELRHRGVDVWMITGDAEDVARGVARLVGIDQSCVRAGVRPAKKASMVAEIQQQSHAAGQHMPQSLAERIHLAPPRTGVAMVGDGVNDAPALAAADVGIAIGGGTAVATETADVILIKSNLWDLVVAHDVASATMTRVMQNLFWAFGYNTIALPLAAGVFYPFFHLLLPPVAAAIAMVMSSVSVVLSSILLLRHQVPAMPDLDNHHHPPSRDSVSAHPQKSSPSQSARCGAQDCDCGCEACRRGDCRRSKSSSKKGEYYKVCCDECHCGEHSESLT